MEEGQLVYSSLNKTFNADRVHYLDKENELIFVAYSVSYMKSTKAQ